MKLKQQTQLFIFISLIILSFATSCKKEDNSMDVVITAKLMKDTTQRVAGAHVFMSQGDVSVEGYTDNSGVFKYTAELPIVLNVVVTKDTLKGLGSVSIGEYLEPAHKTVYLK